MSDQVIAQPGVQSPALAEPTQYVRYRWIAGLTLASLGMWMATQTPLQVMLALQLQDITPRHKIVALGVVTGVGAISSALATPIVGALSDRTAHGRRTGRFSGRRHRWTLAMAVLAAACMVVLAVQGTVLGVALLWFAFSGFQSGLLLLAQPAPVPRLRLGLADPLPGQPGHRHGHPVPALLPPRRGALRAAVPRPDRGGRAAHPDPDLHRLRGGHLDRRGVISDRAAGANDDRAGT
jgi:MFS family permease